MDPGSVLPLIKIFIPNDLELTESDRMARGVATEAARAVVHAAIRSSGYCRLKSGYHMDNPASGGVLMKVGFTVVETSNRPCLAEGRDKPSVEVALIP